MEVIELVPERYAAWNHFCANSDEAWFWHTAEWLQYTLQYRPEWSPHSLSFMIRQDNAIWGICPFVMETRGNGQQVVREGSYGGGPCPAPALLNGLSEKSRRDVLAAIFVEVDRLAEMHGIERVSYRQSPPEPRFWLADPGEVYPLQRHGYLEVSMASQVIDLSLPDSDLLREMRKGHRYDVKRSQKILEARVFDRDSITAERFQQYQEMHYRAAGRATRPAITFRMMQEWIVQGQAILVCAELQGKPVGYALISTYKNGAYYSSSCEEPELGEMPLGHAMQWAAMQWLKQHDFRYYEIGIQPNGQMHGLMSDKESRIALFKRGFGGRTVSYWAGERFYSRSFLRQETERRLREYEIATFGEDDKAGHPGRI